MALIGCSSDDNGKLAELERQLDMEEAARMTAEQERDAAQSAQAASEAARMTTEQAVDDMRKAAVTSAIKKVAAPGQPHRCALDTDCGSDSGVDYSSVSITHDIGYRWHGERLIHAIPWRGDDGQVEFLFRVTPESLRRGPLDILVGTDLRTLDNGDIAGNMTSHSPIEDHGLGSEWQGIEAVKAYDGGGTLTVRFFTDLEETDNPLVPYTNWDADIPDDEIVLTDDRIPDLTGRDWLYFSIPEDGLKGTLDGVAGTFTCPEDYCTLGSSWTGPGYLSWAAPVLFTPDGAGQSKFVRSVDGFSPSAEIPKVNYLSLGSWLYVPEAGAGPDDFRFGIFAGGDDGFAGANLPGLAGTARYAGKATGMYAKEVDIDTFSADVEFTAEFGSASEFGRIGGSVSNFELGSGKAAPLSELLLEADSFGDGLGNISPGWPGHEGSISGGLIGGPARSHDGWHGGWDAKFYGNDGADPTAHPTSFAGAFGANDGERYIAGSFGAYKQ